MTLERLSVTALGLTCVVGIGLTSSNSVAQTPSSPTTLRAAIEMLGSADPMVRTRAACTRDLFNAQATAAIPALLALLDDAEPVAPQVCREDWQRWWGDEQPITPGQEAARALVRIGGASFEPLVQALRSPAPVARRNAAWALGALENSSAVKPLIAALRDSEPAVRRQSAWALGAIEDAAAVDALAAALQDADAKVREQAAWALGAIEDNRAAPALARALKDTDPRVRRQAAWALGAIEP